MSPKTRGFWRSRTKKGCKHARRVWRSENVVSEGVYMVAAPLGPGSSPDPPPPSLRGLRRDSWVCCALMASPRTVPLMCTRIARMALASWRAGRARGPGHGPLATCGRRRRAGGTGTAECWHGSSKSVEWLIRGAKSGGYKYKCVLKYSYIYIYPLDSIEFFPDYHYPFLP